MHVRTETAAIEGSASPRKPRVAMLGRSSAVRSFEVGCRENAVTDLVGGDAGAVVLDPDGSGAALLDGDRDLVGVGVEGIFDEFLDDGGRSFDDFTGGDLGGDVGR